MAHAVAPHLRQRHLDAALLADDAAILHALVLAAQALVVLDRTEDAGAEQAVALRLEGPVVDRLRLLDLAERPGPDALRAGDRDPDLIEALGPGRLAENVHQLVHETSLRSQLPQPRQAGRARRGCRYASGSTISCRWFELDVEAERAQLLHQHVEGFRDAGLEVVVAAHDRLVGLGTARDVVRLHRQHLLQGVGGAVGFQRPDLHLAEALAAELRLAAQRLLGDEAVGADRAGVDLVVHQMVQLQHIDVAHRHLALEALAGAAVGQRTWPERSQPRQLQHARRCPPRARRRRPATRPARRRADCRRAPAVWASSRSAHILLEGPLAIDRPQLLAQLRGLAAGRGDLSSISPIWRPRLAQAQPRWVSRIWPTFMRLGTPSGFSTMSTGGRPRDTACPRPA